MKTRCMAFGGLIRTLESFTGLVDEIDPEKNRVVVVVSMFGRETPVEMELDQVEVVSG